MKNPFAKTRKPNEPYAVYQSVDGSWTWSVLKTYRRPDKEVESPQDARWFCFVTSPHMPSGEYGDVYATKVLYGNRLAAATPEWREAYLGSPSED